MKLATYEAAHGAGAVMGALLPTPQGERLLDLHAACGDWLQGVEGGQARAALGADLLQFVRNGAAALAAARDLLAIAAGLLETDEASVQPLLSDPAQVLFRPPIERPGKIIAIGANYPAHVQEIGDEQADACIAAIGRNLASGDVPPVFAKLPSSLAGHRQAIPYPAFTQQLDYEAELALVLGRDVRDLREADAAGCIAGFMIANDVSARDVQFREMKRGLLLLGKNFEASAPMGPYFVTADEVGDFARIEIRCWVNGELRQSDVAGRMIHSIPRILSYYSRMPLHAGDIFLTGSPAGVGIGRPEPEQYLLKPGDVVEIEMTGLGRLVNVIGQSR